MAVAAAERQQILQQVQQLAVSDLLALWVAAQQLPSGDFAGFIADGFIEVIAPYVSLAGDLAATWFEESDPGSVYVAQTAEMPPTQMLAKSAQWALGADGDAAMDRLEGTTQRAVFNGARETTLLNVEATQSKWARHARADACAFCRLLATRGAAYRSKKTAATKVHDHCYCLPIEVRTGTYEPPDYAQAWEDEYLKARANAGSGDPKQILAAWRSQSTDIK